MIILEKGSAVDGAIAGLICNGIVTAHSMGIGGGFFMALYNRTNKRAEALDAREEAPLSATRDMFRSENASSVLGGLSIAVPGEVKGYQAAHDKYGKLPWAQLFQPTIKLCQEGVPVTSAIRKALNREQNKAILIKDPNFRYTFCGYVTRRGSAFQVGDKVKLPKLARTLEIIADNGAGAFYTSTNLPQDIISDIKDAGGNMTLDDLFIYQAKWKPPTTLTLRDGITIHSVPPPSSGAVYEYILNILDGYNFTADDLSTDEKTVLTHHRIIEAMKFAYAKRTNLGDDAFVNVTELVSNMTSPEFGESIRQMIDDTRTYGTMHYGPTFYDENKVGTSHLAAIDMDGNAVSVTSTINLHFGSKVKGARTGIVFNNEMDDFSTPNLTNYFGIKPSPANFIKPSKRPLSSMCPAIVVNSNGDVVLIAGAAGGTKITTSTALVTLYTLRLGLSVKDAEDFPRLHHQLLPPEVQVETTFDQKYIDALKKYGHNFTTYNPGSSVIQAINIKDGDINAASDWRKGGKPAGY
ncbi:hypothetical protein LOTGIDRAFT_188739 [Lottia gigantea]|uniref:Gamma-glutamyltransferase n=1 Tax=Lottia gigantea TaxID=225164 RepID=V4AF18_LOTGI|nr:hypothetical protein LOTGIDRAFT_188739 [Lottia gigantea]ESO95462.1 hypothetical protein LOTGIDRAFT_188739 [Lottia gigantea]